MNDQPNNPPEDGPPGGVPPKPPELRPMYPVCPYCGTDPASVASTPFLMGPLTVLALFCSNTACRKILALQIVGAQEPKIVAPNQSWKN